MSTDTHKPTHVHTYTDTYLHRDTYRTYIFPTHRRSALYASPPQARAKDAFCKSLANMKSNAKHDLAFFDLRWASLRSFKTVAACFFQYALAATRVARTSLLLLRGRVEQYVPRRPHLDMTMWCFRMFQSRVRVCRRRPNRGQTDCLFLPQKPM